MPLAGYRGADLVNVVFLVIVQVLDAQHLQQLSRVLVIIIV